ncbi:MRC1-like domain-containing protein [Calycina marina]|uniref:MRC1-like domain-containing protein n=1 Tax=Calycina marina TaxID=1763456 RepID=A0A9P7YZ94_9HELO|nr:MRC1-like domain-containing protein [Calycina marina]
MLSSRESSPGMDSTSPLALTPRSKVKALLAQISDDSEDEVVGGEMTARERVRASLFKKTAPNKDIELVTTRGEQREEDGSEEEEEEDIQPRGRMAARMLAAAQNEEKGLADVQTSRESSTSPKNTQKDGEYSDVLVKLRKRKLKIARHATLSSSPIAEDRAESPGLFVSPAKPRSSTPISNNSDDDAQPDRADARFQALVVKKRREREEKEAREAEIKAKKMAERRLQMKEQEEDDDVLDDEVERRLTQSNPPTRKASKKAMDDIHRETQRLSRSNQLAHAPITKKKFSVADFAKRFYKTTEEPKSDPIVSTSSPARHSSSDIEREETPATSPASVNGDSHKGAMILKNPIMEAPAEKGNVEGLPDMTGLASMKMDKGNDKAIQEPVIRLSSSPIRKLDKGKEKAVALSSPAQKSKKFAFAQRPLRASHATIAEKVTTLDNSDSDLEIIKQTPNPRRRKLDSIFDRLPEKKAQESQALHVMKILAHIDSLDGRSVVGRNKKSIMNNSEWQLNMRQRAKQQARQEREEKLQILRDKGIHILTAEEREKELAEVENLVSKARREAEEIMQREREAARKERKANGEVDPLGDNSSDDEEYVEAEEKPAEELSASDDEEDDSEEDGNLASDEEDSEMEDIGLEDADSEAAKDSLIDNEADDTEDDEAEEIISTSGEAPEIDGQDDDDEAIAPLQKIRHSRQYHVISDDEYEDSVMETPNINRMISPRTFQLESPAAPMSVLRSATKTFIPGVAVAGPAGLGLTQIFAGTMAESQMSDEDDTEMPPLLAPQAVDSMAFLRCLPAPELPPFMQTPVQDTQDGAMASQADDDHIPESQTEETQAMALDLGFSQSQIYGFDSYVEPFTQISQFPEATQDVGFAHMTPIKGRFVDVPPSTVDTVLVRQSVAPEAVAETPIVKKKGKLRQHVQIATFSDDEDTAPTIAQPIENDYEITANAFDVMRKHPKKNVVINEFDKKKSNAKGMVHEQAEESEDEYAGLGGASDDESGDEADEYVKEMIDDAGGQHVDERKIAAYHADQTRANDAKAVDKLFTDISKGMLRRKRGADYELSDSDGDVEGQRRRKRAKFAKIQKALMADEKIGKLVENKKAQAFFRALEDRDSEDEMDFLEDFKEQEDPLESQSQSQSQSGEDSQQRVPDSQPDVTMRPPLTKRSDGPAMRLPPSMRRTKLDKKPTNLAEIRESLSSLIEEPNNMLAEQHSDSDSEDEPAIEGAPGDDLAPRQQKDKENRDPFALRRTNINIIDRISLKRQSSSFLSASTRLAFSAASSNPGFKVPPLLRRATTNSSITSDSSVGAGAAMERMAGGMESVVKRGGGKHSGVNFYVRESERRAVVVKTEKRREQRRFKGAKARRKIVSGILGAGKFS